MNSPYYNKIGIEVMSYHTSHLAEELDRLDIIHQYSYRGVDDDARQIAIFWVDTHLGEKQLETLLCAKPGIHYISFYTRRASEEILS